MTFVAEILKSKGSNVWTVAADSTVYDALQLMVDKNIGALMVCDGDNLVGVFSERDYARKVILKGRASKETLVKEIMDTEFTLCRSRAKRRRGLHEANDQQKDPALDQGRLVVSIGDVVKVIIEQQEFTIQQMERHITGARC